MRRQIRKDRGFLLLACTIWAAFAGLPGAKAVDLTLNGNSFAWSSGSLDYGTMSINGNGYFFLGGTGSVSASRYLVGDQSIGSFYLTGGVATGGTMEIGRGGTMYVSGGLFQTSNYMTVGWTGSGTLSVSGGVVRAGILNLGSYNSRGIVAQTSGTVEATNYLSIGRSSATAVSYGLAGGLLTTPKVEVGGGASYAEMFISGGTLSTAQFTKGLPTGGSILTIGGGRIVATGSNASFIPTGFLIQALDGASTIFDTNGKDIGIQSNITRHAALSTSDGGITVTGGGTLTLSATNTFTGQTQLQGATTLRLTGGNALRESTLNITSGTVQFINHTSGTLGGLAGTQGFALTNDLGQAVTLNVGRNHENTTFSGVLSGSGSLVKTGTGTLTLSGNSAYTGGTVIGAGTLALGSAGALGNTGTLAFTGGTLRFSSANTTDYSARFSQAAGQQFRLDTNGQSVTLASSLSSAGGTVTKLGLGTLTLSGSNAYSGNTTVLSGTLRAANNHAVGTGDVVVNTGGVFLVDQGYAVANDVVLSGGEYQRRLTGSLAHALDATSDLGGVDTRASLLGGASVGTTLIASFSATSTASNDIIRRSDVYHFAGTDDAAFALELSFASTEQRLYLGWLDGGQWTNAVDGNTANTATGPMLNYQGSFEEFQAEYGTNLASYIGAYGVDIEGGTTSVWAVLDHNSDFAVIPEPGTAGLLALGGLIALRRRRRG